MKKKNKSTSKKKQPKKKELLESRRGFFKDAALGAGGLAFAAMSAGAVTGCNTNTSQAQSGTGTGNAPAPAQDTDPDEWFEPQEHDLTKRVGLKGTSLQGPEGNRFFPNLHTLNVDFNMTGAGTGQSADLFAYNGTVPGPTFRLRGNQSLSIMFRNYLPGNNGYYAVLQGSRKVMDDKVLPEDTKDWQIDHHMYGPHQQNVSNLHTHGLHVSPGVDHESQDETQQSIHSDNVLLRVIPHEDYVNRVINEKGPPLMDNEQIEQALYNFKLPRPNGTPHYPGTHWYHPHPHGATYDQVASGMAGFLIVEGAIDDYIENLYSKNAYRELPLLIQRIFAPPATNQEQPVLLKGNNQKTAVVTPTVNGQAVQDGYQIPKKQVLANQVIRLRVLNGSVDGQGYIRLMIVKSASTTGPALIDPNARMYPNSNRANKPLNASATAKRWFKDEATDNRICMNNIAYDGINLINSDGEYASMPVEWLTIGVANRADFLIHIPKDSSVGDVFTIWAQNMTESVDQDKTGGQYNLMVGQLTVTDPPGNTGLPTPDLNSDGSLKIDWKNPAGQRMKIEEMLQPIGDAEITIDNNSETTSAYLPSQATNLNGKKITLNSSNNKGKAIRARRVVYSGFGHNSVARSAFDPQVTMKVPGVTPDPTRPTVFNGMVIDGKKYGADTSSHEGWDTAQHKMLLGTAEEWSIYNYSMTSYVNDPATSNTETDNYTLGKSAYLNAAPSGALLRTKAVHHPFHIHQNPFYVKSIQDCMGNELLPLDDDGNPIPRWQDTVYIPHNGGRVIMRSRFWDYTGKYVNHCHLLQHEDWGMMQAVEVVDGKSTSNQPNYIPVPVDDAKDQNIFPPLSLKQMYTLDVGKVKDTFGDTGTNSLKMLCYDPDTTTFFDQTPVTKMVAVEVDQSYYNNSPTQNQDVNEKNVGKLIIPVPTSDKAYPTWNNKITNGSLE